MSYASKMVFAVLAAGLIGGPLASILDASNKIMVGVVVGAIAYALLSAVGGHPLTGILSGLGSPRLTDQGKRLLTDLDRRLAENPSDCTSYIARADIRRVVGDHRRAMADCDKALELEPGNIEARSLRGAILDDRGKYGAAIQEYSKALESHEANAKVHYNRGVSYSHVHRYDEAIADYLRAIELEPHDASTHNNLGLAYVEKKRISDAITEYTRAIALDPGHASAYDNRGYAFMQLGNKEAACRDWHHAATLGMRLNWDVAVRNNDVPGPLLLFTTDEQNLEPTRDPENLQERLIRAVRGADQKEVVRLLHEGADPNGSPRGVTALHVVAERGPLDVAAALLASGADTNAHCRADRKLHGRTPLVLAVVSGSVDMISLLVTHGADINARDGDGMTPIAAAIVPWPVIIPGLEEDGVLSWSLSLYRPDLVQTLLKHGADPNQPFDSNELELSGITPLMAAAMHPGDKDAIDLCRMLIESGAHTNAMSPIGKTAVHFAEQAGNLGAASLLRKGGTRTPNTGASLESSSHRPCLGSKCSKYCTVVGVPLAALGIAIMLLFLGPTTLDNLAIGAATFGMVLFVAGAVLCLVAAVLRYLGS